jgi:hypothetical protein
MATVWGARLRYYQRTLFISLIFRNTGNRNLDAVVEGELAFGVVVHLYVMTKGFHERTGAPQTVACRWHSYPGSVGCHNEVTACDVHRMPTPQQGLDLFLNKP